MTAEKMMEREQRLDLKLANEIRSADMERLAQLTWADKERIIAALRSSAVGAGAREAEAARENLREAWAALAMIRETIETLAPSGSVKAAEHLAGPTFTHEADALVEGIIAIQSETAAGKGEQPIEQILFNHFYTGEPGQHEAIKAAAADLENLRIRSEPVQPADDWKDDPSADERWNTGVDFVMKLLCDYLGVDPNAVTWDAATETVDGDVSAVIGNILRTKFGEDWGPDDAQPRPAGKGEQEPLDRLESAFVELMERFEKLPRPPTDRIDMLQYCLGAIRDVRSSLPVRPEAPAGWQLVPIKPTPSMLFGASRKIIASTKVIEIMWAKLLSLAPALPTDPVRRTTQQGGDK